MTHLVHIESSDQSLTVNQGETILAAALQQGVIIPHGCRSGVCGACKAAIIEGEIDYGAASPKSLNEKEKTSGIILTCLAVPQTNLRLHVREVKNNQEIVVRNLPNRVIKKELLAPDVMRLFLKIPANERFNFLPGQYLEFILSNNRRRAFSLANSPLNDNGLLELHIKRIPDGSFTNWLFDEMPENALMRIQGPFGSFSFREDSTRPVILIAGGTGFAPIKSILEYVFAKAITRQFHLYWGVRNRCDLYLDELPRQWAQQYPNFRYTPLLSRPTSADNWQGNIGHAPNLVIADYPDLSNYEIYACGPPALVSAGLTTFIASGLPPNYYYADAFEYAKDP